MYMFLNLVKTGEIILKKSIYRNRNATAMQPQILSILKDQYYTATRQRHVGL